jgi:ankyrin repeat protein
MFKNTTDIGKDEQALITAINNDNVEEAERLITDHKLNVDMSVCVEDRSMTLLIYAAKVDSINIIKALCDKGADKEAKDDVLGRTALIWAIKTDHIAAVQALLDAGANIYAQDQKTGFCVLHYAVLCRNHNMVILLINKGAMTIGAEDKNGWTALHWATFKGYIRTVKALLSAGADPNKAVNQDGTALIIAAKEGHTEVVNVLLGAGADPDSVDRDGKTALILAVQYRRAETVQALLVGGADSLVLADPDAMQVSIGSAAEALKDKMASLFPIPDVLDTGSAEQVAGGGGGAAADGGGGSAEQAAATVASKSSYREATRHLVHLIKLARRDKKHDGPDEYQGYKGAKHPSWIALLDYVYQCDAMLHEKKNTLSATHSAEGGGAAAAAPALKSETDYFVEFLELLTRLDALYNANLSLRKSKSERQEILFARSGKAQSRDLVNNVLASLINLQKHGGLNDSWRRRLIQTMRKMNDARAEGRKLPGEERFSMIDKYEADINKQINQYITLIENKLLDIVTIKSLTDEGKEAMYKRANMHLASLCCLLSDLVPEDSFKAIQEYLSEQRDAGEDCQEELRFTEGLRHLEALAPSLHGREREKITDFLVKAKAKAADEEQGDIELCTRVDSTVREPRTYKK